MKLYTKEISYEKNIFDIIRLWAILQVTIGHCTGHLDVGLPAWVMNFFSFPGVVVLFALSGYLVTSSWDKLMNNGIKGSKKYLGKRFRRIYPALWCSIVISSVCIIIFYNIKPNLKESIIYIGTQFTGLNFYTGDWLRGYGVGAPNGSLWTIIVEVEFYILIMFVWKYIKKQRLYMDIIILGFSIILNILSGELEAQFPDSIMQKLYGVSILSYFYIFMIGVMAYKYRVKFFKLIGGWNGWRGMILLVVTVCAFKFMPTLAPGIGGYTNIFTGLFIATATLISAYVLGKKIRLPFDISYGIYLYHMIIVNVFVQVGWTNNMIVLFISSIGSVGCGFLSWYCLEKKIQERK